MRSREVGLTAVTLIAQVGALQLNANGVLKKGHFYRATPPYRLPVDTSFRVVRVYIQSALGRPLSAAREQAPTQSVPTI